MLSRSILLRLKQKLLELQWPSTPIRYLNWILVAFAAYYIAAFVIVCAKRLPLPFDLAEPLEGVIVIGIQKILHGEPIYTAPTLKYTSLIYGPGYYYLSALFSLVLGEGYFAPRLISALASIGTFFLVGRLVFRETCTILPGIIAAGLFAGCYSLTGHFYDYARVDALYIFLVAASAYVVRFHTRPRDILLAATCAAAAILTKQTAIVPVFALGFWIALNNLRNGVLFLASALLPAVGILTFMNCTSGGWLKFFLFDTPAAHPFSKTLLAEFLVSDLIHGLGLGACFSLVALVLLRQGHDRRRELFYWFLSLSVFFATLIPRIKIGGWVNNLIPLCMMISVLCGLGYGLIGQKKKGWVLLSGIFLAAFNGQLLYYPFDHTTTENFVAENRELQASYKRLPNPVWIPNDSYRPKLLGMSSWANYFAMSDVFMAKDKQGVGLELQHTLATAFKDRQFGSLVLKRENINNEYFPISILEKGYRSLSKEECEARGLLSDGRFLFYVRK